MSSIMNNLEKTVINFQNSIIKIGKLAADFQNSIIKAQLLVERTIKIALIILAALAILFLIREYFSWRMQVRLQKQHLELLQKMSRIITLLEENIKNKK